MRVVLRILAWIWIVVNGLGMLGTVMLTLIGGEPVKALIVLGAGALLVSPGVVLLWLTKPKAPQD